ncbi:hypothetical protein BDQ17DRAFT_1422002 [Cyathus striatus]|nr:hypothetical protein BDQ17DRAFT_1422002 [Cyathus striatus]
MLTTLGNTQPPAAATAEVAAQTLTEATGPQKAQKIAAARAREAKAHRKLGLYDNSTPIYHAMQSDNDVPDSESEDGMGWDGTVIHMPSNFEDSEGEWEEINDTDEGSLGIYADDDLEDVEGIKLLEGLRRQWEIEKDL